MAVGGTRVVGSGMRVGRPPSRRRLRRRRERGGPKRPHDGSTAGTFVDGQDQCAPRAPWPSGSTRRLAHRRRRLLTRPVLAARLAHLVGAGLLERAPYREAGQRTRFEYRLTQRGADLRPVLVALMQYGDEHLAEDAGPPVELRHRGCGADVHVALV